MNSQDLTLAAKTAKTRNRLSAPMRWLKDNNLLIGPILDYGCGKGGDVKRLHTKGYDIEGWDPVYFKREIDRKFNTITCIYVLNVIRLEEDRQEILDKMEDMLVEGGIIYLVVRRDIETDGFTARGNWQSNLYLDLESIHERKKKFQIYKIRKSHNGLGR